MISQKLSSVVCSFYQHHEIQKEVLARQLKLATQINKPIVIHSRESEADIITELEKVRTVHRVGCGDSMAKAPDCQSKVFVCRKRLNAFGPFYLVSVPGKGKNCCELREPILLIYNNPHGRCISCCQHLL